MKLRIRYENTVTTIDVPEEDCSLMIQTDYEKRCEKADDSSTVHPRTPQEIIDERFNKPDYNNWHRQHRHTDPDFCIRKLSGRRGVIPVDDMNEDYGCEVDRMDMFADDKGERAREQSESYDDVCEYVRTHLKPEEAEAIITVRLDGVSCIDYGSKVGETGNTVNHRLRRAEKKLKKIWESCPF